MTGRGDLDAAARSIALWAVEAADRVCTEHADVFERIQRAKNSGDFAAEQVLMSCLEDFEYADPARKAELLKAIRNKGKRGRPPGSSEVRELREPFIKEARQRIAAGESKASIVSDLAKRLPGATSLSSAKSYLREALKDAE